MAIFTVSGANCRLNGHHFYIILYNFNIDTDIFKAIFAKKYY